MVTVPILSLALAAILHNLGYDTSLFSLHSLHSRGVMAAYRQGLDQIDIKRQGLWTSDAFWHYITLSCTATSPLAAGLTRAFSMATTASTSPTSYSSNTSVS